MSREAAVMRYALSVMSYGEPRSGGYGEARCAGYGLRVMGYELGGGAMRPGQDIGNTLGSTHG